MIVTNRRCAKKITDYKGGKHELLHNCSIFPDIQLTEVLGEGSFGIVYLGEATYTEPSSSKKNSPRKKKIKVAVKFIKADLSAKDFESLNLEITYSYNMGIMGLGPKIYDAFYYIDKSKKYRQVIIMDYYKYDGLSALKIANTQQSIDIVTQMINLIKQMIFVNGMYCVDIKPSNFIINETLTDVKLIDFGSDWCTPEKLMTDTEDDLFQLLLFQLSILIDDVTILNTEMLGRIFCKYFSKNIINIIDKYYDDPSLTVKHYANRPKTDAINYANAVKSNCDNLSKKSSFFTTKQSKLKLFRSPVSSNS